MLTLYFLSLGGWAQIFDTMKYNGAIVGLLILIINQNDDVIQICVCALKPKSDFKYYELPKVTRVRFRMLHANIAKKRITGSKFAGKD